MTDFLDNLDKQASQGVPLSPAVVRSLIGVAKAAIAINESSEAGDLLEEGVLDIALTRLEEQGNSQ